MKAINSNLTIRNFITYLLSSVSNSSSIVITGHNNADPDALAAVMGLKEFLNQIDPRKKINLVLNLNKLAEKIYKEILSDPKWNFSKIYPENIDLLIVTDTSDLGMAINKDGTSPIIQNIIIIDHHVNPIKLDNRVKHSLILTSSAIDPQ